MASDWSPKSANQFMQAFDFAGELAEKEVLHQQEILDIFQRFLEIKDSLEALLVEQVNKKKPPGQETADILRWVELLDHQFTLAFERCGVTAIECIGQEADPQLHHVVGVVEQPEAELHTIIQEKVKGYYYRDMLLRRPEVVVADNKVKAN
jgi:molecular chaperone GrpE